MEKIDGQSPGLLAGPGYSFDNPGTRTYPAIQKSRRIDAGISRRPAINLGSTGLVTESGYIFLSSSPATNFPSLSISFSCLIKILNIIIRPAPNPKPPAKAKKARYGVKD